jgi:hypothetical protein
MNIETCYANFLLSDCVRIGPLRSQWNKFNNKMTGEYWTNLRIGSYEIPEIRFVSGALNDIKKIYDSMKSVDRQIHANDLAILLGYKTPTSGGFYRRINSLISYGLLEGRGRFRVTKTGEDILYPSGEEQKSLLLRESVLRVSLWNELYRKYKKNLPENFWLGIKELTGVSSAEAQTVEKEIRRWYLQDIEPIAEEVSSSIPRKEQDVSNNSIIDDKMKEDSVRRDAALVSNEIEEIPFAGKYAIKKPVHEDVRRSWERLKRYMEIYLEDFEEESSRRKDDPETP